MTHVPAAGSEPPARPLPRPTPTSAPYWEGLAGGQLLLQHCRTCAAWIHYPRVRCPACFGTDLAWEAVEAAGVLYTFTVAVRPTAPMFAGSVPQVIGVVELPVGVRITTTIETDAPDLLRVGTAVRGVFDTSEGVALLRFAPDR
ncbi:MAG: OB-fold domain-containing protein [Acidobacteriota bacterium]|nr:OB-fold domain-containing protein [Acidobacteriota bacterium]